MMPANQADSKTQSLFPPRQIPPIQYQLPILENARRSLELKSNLLNRFENRLFNIASNAKLTEEERKAVRKDQKNYIKMFSSDLYKKFPAQLFLSEKELKARIKSNRMRQLQQKGKQGVKRTLKKILGEKKQKQENQEQKNQAVELNRHQSDRSEGLADDLGDLSELDDGQDDNNQQLQGGEYQDQI